MAREMARMQRESKQENSIHFFRMKLFIFIPKYGVPTNFGKAQYRGNNNNQFEWRISGEREKNSCRVLDSFEIIVNFRVSFSVIDVHLIKFSSKRLRKQ